VNTVGCTETTTRTYRATDPCGNTAVCTQTIIRTVDITPPTITCPAPPTLTCNQAVPAPNVASVTATDACGTPTVTFVGDAVNTVGCTETTTRTYRATDPCGNTAVCTQTIIRTVDITPPTITCPAPPTLTCNQAVPAPDPTSVTAIDACGTPTVTFVGDAVNTVGCTETTTRTYRATDPCGNTAVCTQTIIRTVDITPPTITCPAPPTLTCNQAVPAPNVASVTATDACGTPTVTFVGDAMNTVGCTETTTRTYRATDPCGNTATCTQTIIRTVDITPPTITCPAPPTLTCNQAVPAPNVASVTAIDACGTPTVTFVGDAVNTVGCTETTTRTYRATDPCGNTAVCTQTIIRTVDITPPTITCPAPPTLTCNQAVPAPNVASVTATDACGTPTVTFVGDAMNTVGCTETTTRTYRATDPCGNTATCTQTIIRTVDITPPTITCPAPPTLTCNQAVPAPNVASVTATDACGTPTVTFVGDAVNTVGCTETTTRTYRATDPCGNTAVCTQTIIRTVDITPPSITCPAPPTLTCNQAVPAPDPTSVTATDACGTPTVTFVGDAVNTVGCTENNYKNLPCNRSLR
jgi:hypothetical protein